MTLELSTLKWDMQFLEIAQKVSTWSKDPSTKVGAVIYAADKSPVSQGYNGFPRGMDDDERLLNRELKYQKIIHAEENAILFAKRDLDGCSIYNYPFLPCCHCASLLVQSRISRVVTFKNNIVRWAQNMEEARNTFKECGVELVEYDNEDLERLT